MRARRTAPSRLEQPLACARVDIGLALLLAPSRSLRLWVGPAVGPSVHALTRAVGLRGLALGWTLAAAARADQPRRHLYAGASVVDLFDGAMALALSGARRPAAAIAAGAGLMGC